MPVKENEVISIRKLKKDGSIDEKVLRKIVRVLREGHVVVMPIDRVYGIVGLSDSPAAAHIPEISGQQDERIIRAIPSFRMLDDIALYDKYIYDFLHRIWPGDVVVRLKKKNMNSGNTIPVFIPRHRFFQDILDTMDRPLLFAAGINSRKRKIFRDSDIIKKYKSKARLILIVQEFCREYPLPTFIDVSHGDLRILGEGRVPSEEIKSLYFLGADDSAET